MMTVRQATKNDISRIVELRLINAHYHAEIVSGGKLKPTATQFFLKQTSKILDDDQTKVLVGIIDEQVIAYTIGIIGQEHPLFDFGDQALIDDVFVCQNFQRQGYGHLLMEHLLPWFKENNIKRINLNVYEANSKGASFWRKRGFEPMFRRMTKEL